MRRFSSSSASALTSRIRGKRDVIASCVHLLAYWPRNSLVLMTTDGKGLGPLIRVDLADPSEVSVGDYLEIPFGSMPHCGGTKENKRRAFVLLFGEKISNYLDLPRSMCAQPVTEADQVLINIAGHYIESLDATSSQFDVEMLDIIVVGQSTYWSINPGSGRLEPVGWVSDVFSSPVYAELVAKGSVVSGSPQEAYDAQKWDPLESNDIKEAERWLALAEVAANNYLERKYSLNPCDPFQAEMELRLWDRLLEAVSNLFESDLEGGLDSSRRGDQLRHLIPPDMAGYLVASLNNSAMLHYVVYLACSDIDKALDALNLLEQYTQNFLSAEEQRACLLLPDRETLSAFGLKELSSMWRVNEDQAEGLNDKAGPHFAGMISGALSTPPDWTRLEALDYICTLFENIASHKCESMFIAAQAWVRWLCGNSTSATYILGQADLRYFESVPLLLQHLLDSSVIPLWLTEPGGAPPYR